MQATSTEVTVSIVQQKNFIMKKLFFVLIVPCIVLVACQKSAQYTETRTERTADSTIVAGDTLTYEVLTSDPVGWFGIWNEANGELAGNSLDSGTYGSPVYLPNGWRYSFAAPSRPFQAFISVATHLFNDDITVNLYRNGQLIKSETNGAMKGVAKLLVDIETDSLHGTASNPALTYEVLVSEPDATKFQSDAWTGQWNTAKGIMSNLSVPLNLDFAIPSGWKYTFRPEQLPFTMRMGASPYTKDGGKIIINFYVNGHLVKTSSSRDWIYYMDYTVQ